MKNIKNIKKEIKQIAEKETPQFQSWLQQNNQRVNDQLNGAPFRSQTVAKPNRLAKWAIACACMMIFVVVSLPFVLKTTQTPPPSYGSSDIYYINMTTDEYEHYMDSMGFDFALQNLSATFGITKDEQQMKLIATIYGHYEIVGVDYYIFNFTFLLNDAYQFAKESYESLTEKVVVGDYTIYYGEGKASLLKAAYLLKIQYKGNVCYLHVDCFEHSLESLLALLTNTQN